MSDDKIVIHLLKTYLLKIAKIAMAQCDKWRVKLQGN